MRYSSIVPMYIAAEHYGIGLVIAHRKADVIVYSITEGKEVLVRAGSIKLLSGGPDEQG